MTYGRRQATRGLLAFMATSAAAAAGLLTPLRALAAWPKAAFDAKSVKELNETLFKGASVAKSSVEIVAPDMAENGAIVPITVNPGVAGAQTITVIAEENPRPLAAVITLGKRATGPVSLRVKLSRSQSVTAVVQAQDKLYSASRKISVSVGGCGG